MTPANIPNSTLQRRVVATLVGLMLGLVVPHAASSSAVDVPPSDEFVADQTGTASAQRDVEAEYLIRVVYLVPSNRSPQPDVVAHFRTLMLTTQAWFAEQMDRLGYGPKTIRFETEEDGITPKVNLAFSDKPDSALHDPVKGRRWQNVLAELRVLGFEPFQSGEILWVFPEMHVQLPDGSFDQSTLFYGGANQQDIFAGLAMLSSEPVSRFDPDLLADDRPYEGLILPAAGPYPLVQGVSYPNSEGTTLSSVSSSAQGGAIHELTHTFGLPHDFRNDRNFNGNVIGNGFRGLRGALYPERYPNDDMRLSSGSALRLTSSRFFNAGAVYDDDTPPTVELLEQGTVTPQHGLVQIRFRAVDADSTLAGAVLLGRGPGNPRVVAHTPLNSSEIEETMAAYDYRPGVTEAWRVVAWDAQGNVGRSDWITLTVAAGYNRAPLPFIEIDSTLVGVGEPMTLSAARSSDPDGPNADLVVEWDLDGDGVFDTPPTIEKTYTTTYDTAGVYQVSARLTDPVGDSAVSLQIGVRVEQRNTPPDCSGAVASRTMLWPSNHKFVTVDVLGVTDPDGDPVAVRIDAIYQDEPVTGRGSGNTAPDADGIGMSSAELRAERSGFGNGRVYHVFFSADDGQGAACDGEVTVSVPHDRRGRAAIDGGPVYVSTLR